MSVVQSSKNCITLKGSAQIITEYLKFGINSILFQRGIYPPESFTNTTEYGLSILISTDPTIDKFLNNVLQQITEWLSKDQVTKISMVIIKAHTKETLECWEFNMQAEARGKENIKENMNEPASNKDLIRIQNEIRDVMRQIAATVSYLPLLETICSFDVMVHTTLDSVDVPEKWIETTPATIPNAQSVPLRSFSTGLHHVETVVNYKKP